MNKCLFFISLILLVTSAPDDGVTALTKSTFDKFINTNEFTLVEFYGEQCPHCVNFAPTYVELAKKVKASNINVKIAKIEGNQNSEITNQHNIQGYPTLKFFSNTGKAFEYKGDMEIDPIIEFINNKINKKTGEITSLEQFKNLEKDTKLFAVICGSVNTNKDAFLNIDKVLINYENFNSFFTENAEVKAELECSNEKLDVILVKQFEDKRVKFSVDKFVKSKFVDFLETYTIPTVSDLSNEIFEKAISNSIPAVIVVLKEENPEIAKIIFDLAKSKKKKAIFIQTIEKGELQERLLEYYSVKDEHIPTILGLKSQGEANISKYKFDLGELNKANIEKWVNLFLTNKLKKFYQSEPIPTEPEVDGVRIVVGNNFKKEVLENDKDVLLEVYAPWCGHCKQLEPKYARVAQKLKNNVNLVIAKMDSTANEYDGLDVEGFPTLILFKGGKKGVQKFKNRQVFEGARSVNGIIDFLKNSTFHGVKDIIELENEGDIESKEREDEERENEGGEAEETEEETSPKDEF